MKKILYLALALVSVVLMGCDTTVTNQPKYYMIQCCNEYGESIDYYWPMTLYKKVGNTFEEAYESIENQINGYLQAIVDSEKGCSIYDTERWELRQVVRKVQNSPDEKLIYTSLELYMFSYVYNAYIIRYKFFVIDSEGNIYKRIEPLD